MARLGSLLRALAVTAGLALLGGATACTAPYDDDVASEDALGATAVELVLRRDGVEVLSFRPATEVVGQVPTRGAELRWELTDATGAVVASAFVEDPRTVRSEHAPEEAVEVQADVGRLRVVVPASGGTLTIFEPAVDGWLALGEVYVPAPGPGGVLEQNLVDASEDLLGAPVLVHPAATEDAVRLLVVGDGYTQAQIAAYAADTEALIQRLLAVEGFAEHAGAIEVYRQDVKSDHAGVADPATGYDPVTAFELSFGDGVRRPRRCMMYEPQVGVAAMAAIRDRTLAVKADAVVILSQSDEYGGCASPSDRVVTVSRHPSSAQILAHELGHTLFGLSDEYVHGTCGPYLDGPNVASDPHALPWADLVTTSTLPTPISAPAGTIGAFEGANHCHQGKYRPTHACRMRELADAFCPVCQAEIDRFFELRAEGRRGAIDIDNRTGVGLYVRCPNQPGPGCSDWTYLQPGRSARIRTTGDGYAFFADADLPGSVDISWRRLVPGRSRAVVYANPLDPLEQP